MKSKECSKCKEIKSLDNFNRQITTKDGLAYYCTSCLKLYRKLNKKRMSEAHRIYAKKNRDIINKAQRKWNGKNPEYHNDYYRKNTEKRKEQAKKSYLKIKKQTNL